MHDGRWLTVADDRRGLPDFDTAYPHAPFMPDPQTDVNGAVEAMPVDAMP